MILNYINDNNNILEIRELIFNKIKTLSLQEQERILDYTNITDINNFVIQDIYIKHLSNNSCLFYFFKRDSAGAIIETPLSEVFEEIQNYVNQIQFSNLKADIITQLKQENGYKISFCDDSGILLEIENKIENRLNALLGETN